MNGRAHRSSSGCAQTCGVISRSCVSFMCTRGEYPAIVPPLERDDFSSSRHPALSFCLSMISAQTLRVCREGKPVPTLGSSPRACFSGSCSNRVQGWPRFQGWRFDRTPKPPEHAQRCCRYRQRGCYPRVGAACWGAPKPVAEGPYSEHGGWGCLGGAAVPGGALQHADGWGHLAGSGRRAMRQEGYGAVEALAPLVWNRQAGSPWKLE